MQYKIKVVDVPCPGCGRTTVKHHGKGLCNACYHRSKRKEKRDMEKVIHSDPSTSVPSDGILET